MTALDQLAKLDLDQDFDAVDNFIEISIKIYERQTALFCQECGAAVQDRGGWYHCVKFGHAVTPVDASGKTPA